MNRILRVLPAVILMLSAAFPLISHANGSLNTTTNTHRAAPVNTYNNSGPAVSFSYSYGPTTQHNHNATASFRHQSAPVYQYQYDRGRQHHRDDRHGKHNQPQHYGNRPDYSRNDYRQTPRVEPVFQSCLGNHCNDSKNKTRQ